MVHIPRIPSESGFPPGTGPDPRRTAVIQELQDEICRQRLLLETLCRLLLEKGIVKEEELAQWIEYIDGLDGNVDGKIREDRSPVECSKCRRKNSTRAKKCQYCGQDLPLRVLNHRPPEGDPQ